VSSFVSGALVPAWTHQDPRYFRSGEGSKSRRVGHAISRLVIARSDRGKTTLNYGEVFGMPAAALLSGLYYPKLERNGSNLGLRLSFQVAGDAATNLLREFGPDLQRRIFRKQPPLAKK
jgi:hypothetical protein